jgi:hypothetical protein
VTEEEEQKKKLQSPYARHAIEWITVAAFAGIVLAILGCAAAIVAWSWGLI